MRGIKANIEILSKDEIERIHKGALKILERTGVSVPLRQCVELCEKLGAVVDYDSMTVKIPPELMEEVLELGRAQWKQEDSGEGFVRKPIGHIYTDIYIIDYNTNTKRYGTLEDVMKGIALVDSLENIQQSNAVVMPYDVPAGICEVTTHRIMYSYSQKPGGTYILTPESAGYIIEMSKVINRKMIYALKVISPLQFRKESLEMGLVFAQRGCELSLGPMVIGGATGPVTVAGILTLQTAENLASLFMIYAMSGKPGRFYGGACHSMDLRTTMCSYGSPNQALLAMAIAQIGKYYGLLTSSNSALTDSLLPDYQCGFEKTSSVIMSCFAGNAGLGAQGMVGADQGFSFEQLVLDNEWLNAFCYILDGINADDEMIAADIVENVGIGGTYLAEEHTVKHMKDSYWMPKNFTRLSFDAWKEQGSRTLLEKAHDYVEQVVKTKYPRVPVIDPSKYQELEYIEKDAVRSILEK
mgnify:CR=1 FL=1